MKELEKKEVIGSSLYRQESFARVMGTAKYTKDLKFPGMAYGKILRSPYPHARVKKIDVKKAKKVPGVLEVLTYEDVPGEYFNCSGTPPSGMVIKDEKILTNTPKYVGDRIAAVAATSEKACEMALKEIKVEYEKLPHVFHIDDALKDNAPLIQPELFSSNIGKTMVKEDGDVEKAFEQSTHVFEKEFTTPTVQHTPLEPTGCICHYQKTDNKLTVWSTSQTPHHDRRILAELLGLTQNKVEIIKPVMGGGFGARQQTHSQPVCAFLSKMTGRPIKMINDREEEMYASAVRHASRIKVRIGLDDAGKMAGVDFEAYINTGGYITQGPIVLASMSRKMQYSVLAYRFVGHCVYTNAPVAGAMRGYGNPQLNFARESLINEICEKMGFDPVEFRLKNHLTVGDKVPAQNYTVKSCEIKECVNKAKDIKTRIKEEKKEDETEDKAENTTTKSGWGVAFASHGSGITERDQSGATIIINDDGTANLYVGAADIGQGCDTVLSQIAAQELGIELSKITPVAADTRYTPYDTGTFASRQAYVSGNAVLNAARDAIEKIKARLAGFYEIEKDQVDFENGFFKLNLSDGIKNLYFQEAVTSVSFGEAGQVFIGRGTYKPSASPPPFAVCFARVEVEMETGKVRVSDVIMTADVGKALNPQIVEGQIQGGVSMGVGFALSEILRMDPKFKKPIESNLLDYKVQFTVDSPRIYVDLADSYEPTGPFGAKSVGELPAVPVASAVGDALYNVTGYRVTGLPINHSFKPKYFALEG